MVGGDHYHPFFVEIGLAVFNRLPNPSDLPVCQTDGFVECFSVTEGMSGIVGVPKVNPTQVRGVFLYAFCCLLGDVFVNVQNMKVMSLMGEGRLVQFVTVTDIVNLEVACFWLTLAYKYGPVVNPA